MDDHYWSYCNECKRRMVVCGMCGNNCCNGGYGSVFGPDPDKMVPCPSCPSAYDMQADGDQLAIDSPG